MSDSVNNKGSFDGFGKKFLVIAFAYSAIPLGATGIVLALDAAFHVGAQNFADETVVKSNKDVCYKFNEGNRFSEIVGSRANICESSTAPLAVKIPLAAGLLAASAGCGVLAYRTEKSRMAIN